MPHTVNSPLPGHLNTVSDGDNYEAPHCITFPAGVDFEKLNLLPPCGGHFELHTAVILNDNYRPSLSVG
jgi:hypothetical protein